MTAHTAMHPQKLRAPTHHRYTAEHAEASLPMVVERLMDAGFALAEASVADEPDQLIDALRQWERCSLAAKAVVRSATAPKADAPDPELPAREAKLARQRREALATGNRRRAAASKLKADINDLASPAYEGERARARRARQLPLLTRTLREARGDEAVVVVYDLLCTIHRVNVTKVKRMMQAENVGPTARLRDLTDRQRAALAIRVELTIGIHTPIGPDTALSVVPRAEVIL